MKAVFTNIWGRMPFLHYRLARKDGHFCEKTYLFCCGVISSSVSFHQPAGEFDQTSSLSFHFPRKNGRCTAVIGSWDSSEGQTRTPKAPIPLRARGCFWVARCEQPAKLTQSSPFSPFPSPQAQQGATLQNYNNELVKCIEDLRYVAACLPAYLLHCFYLYLSMWWPLWPRNDKFPLRWLQILDLMVLSHTREGIKIVLIKLWGDPPLACFPSLSPCLPSPAHLWLTLPQLTAKSEKKLTSTFWRRRKRRLRSRRIFLFWLIVFPRLTRVWRGRRRRGMSTTRRFKRWV